MITISLCMIVKNEEAVLARCLSSVAGIVDEIVVVDTGSTDRTAEIAARYTDKVLHFDWVDDFSAARNASFEAATMEYILWLDADDIILPEDREKFLALKQDFPPEVDVAMLPYRIAFDEQENCTFHYFRERLVRREKGYRWREPVHEHIAFQGVTREFAAAVTHAPENRDEVSTRNLEIYRAMEERGERFSTRALYYYARELRTHGRFEDAARRYRRFFARGDGWVEDKITACGDLAECLRALGKKQEAVEALCRAFSFDLPRAETCCMLGRIYMRDELFEKAQFWYELALLLPRPKGWGFVTEDLWGFVPHMQLCVLHDRRGERAMARLHHEAAKALKPQDPAVLHNEAYFAQAQQETGDL